MKNRRNSLMSKVLWAFAGVILTVMVVFVVSGGV